MPYKKSTQKKYGENPMRGGFKMKGSPMQRNFPSAFKKELPKSLQDKINKFSPWSLDTHTPMGKLRKGYRKFSDMTAYTPDEVKLIKASKKTGTK
tara:strand:- start:197 stop:481 length:285 start_codon:yes stop_codon:yes gene_type:complete